MTQFFLVFLFPTELKDLSSLANFVVLFFLYVFLEKFSLIASLLFDCSSCNLDWKT